MVVLGRRRALETLDCLVDFSCPRPGDAEIVEGFQIARHDREGLCEGSNRLLQHSSFHQDQAKIVKCFDMRRFQLNGLTIGGKCALHRTLFLQGDAKVVISIGMRRIECEGLVDTPQWIQGEHRGL